MYFCFQSGDRSYPRSIKNKFSGSVFQAGITEKGIENMFRKVIYIASILLTAGFVWHATAEGWRDLGIKTVVFSGYAMELVERKIEDIWFGEEKQNEE